MRDDVRPYLLPLALLWLGLSSLGCASAPRVAGLQDRVVLEGGGELTGEVIQIDCESVLFSHDTLGVRSIPIDQVIDVAGDGVSLITAEGDELEVVVLRRGDRWIQVLDGEELRWLELASLRKDPLRLRWDTDLTFGSQVVLGNTNERGTLASARVVGQNDGERVTGELDWAYAEDRSRYEGDWKVSRRRLRAALQYDYRALEDGFFWASSSALNDAYADIDLQLISGVGAGYEFLKNEPFKLSASAGLTYVKRDFRNSEDREYPAGRAAMSLAWKPVRDIEFAQDASVVPSLSADEASDVIVRVDTRLRWALLAQLFAQLRWTVDHDSEPAPGTEKTDQSLGLQLGLSF